MTKEDKELLLKDLCARLPYGVICHANEINIDGELLFVNKLYNIVALYCDNATGKFESCPINDIKPYLRPMSSMTGEEKKVQKDYIYHFSGNNLPNYEGDFVFEDEAHEYIDWLLAHHFDIWNLIENGLAIEAPKTMYKSTGRI